MSVFPIPKETVDKIVELRLSGLKHREIGEKLGYQTGTIKGVCKRKGICKPKSKKVDVSKLIKDRLTMPLVDVAKKHGITVDTVSRLTKDSPLVKGLRHSRTSKSPQDKAEMQKGHVKLKKDEKILKSRTFDQTKQRHVFIPSKNMTVSVKMDDNRSNQEIIDSYLNRDKKYLESCKWNYSPKKSELRTS